MNVLQKRARIKVVTTLCGKLGIADDERHAIQVGRTGKSSLTKMAVWELDLVIDHLRKIENGGKPANEWAFVFDLKPDRQRFARKIFRLAETIGAMQTPPVPVMSKAYIEGIAEQMIGTDTVLQFCAPELLHKVVKALEVFVKRHGG